MGYLLRCHPYDDEQHLLPPAGRRSGRAAPVPGIRVEQALACRCARPAYYLTISGGRLVLCFIILPGQRSGYRVKPYFLADGRYFSLIMWSGSKIIKQIAPGTVRMRLSPELAGQPLPRQNSAISDKYRATMARIWRRIPEPTVSRAWHAAERTS